MWSLVFKFLTGIFTTSLGSISRDLKDAYAAKLNAANDKERMLSDERIALLEARKSTIMAAQSDPMERWVRIGFALPFVIYVNKLVLYDKVLEWGVTDPLSTDLTQLFWVIISGYFVHTTVTQTARILKK